MLDLLQYAWLLVVVMLQGLRLSAGWRSCTQQVSMHRAHVVVFDEVGNSISYLPGVLENANMMVE